MSVHRGWLERAEAQLPTAGAAVDLIDELRLDC
jgi:hypothetical protein